MARKAPPSPLSVKISSPTQVYFEGDVHSISAANDVGPFDVLPEHHNFITLLSPGVIVIVTTQGATKQIEAAGGLMHVKDNQVRVFLDF